MKHIFYFLTIFPIMWEMINLMDTKKAHNFFKEYEKVIDDDAITPDQIKPKFSLLAIFMTLYWMWIFIGLFSFQWPVFLFIVLISFVPKKWEWYRKIDALITVVSLIFIILNAYHFKINTWEIIQKIIA